MVGVFAIETTVCDAQRDIEERGGCHDRAVRLLHLTYILSVHQSCSSGATGEISQPLDRIELAPSSTSSETRCKPQPALGGRKDGYHGQGERLFTCQPSVSSAKHCAYNAESVRVLTLGR